MDLQDRLLRHDAWTTRRLLELSLSLSDEQLDQEFDLGWKTVRRTFTHLISNVECWTDLMSGATEVRPHPDAGTSIPALIERLDQASSDLHEFARRIADAGQLNDTFLDRLDDPPRRKTFGGAILHVATHGMHHRAQLLYMLRRLGVKDLPEGDVLSWEAQHTGAVDAG